MLEKFVADMLTKYLGQYVDNLDKDSLNISIWKGDISLENLRLKKGALDAFSLPITVTHGYLGKLMVKIPWTSLKSSPVIIEIDNVYVVTKPKKSQPWNEAEEKIKAIALKKQKLDAYEILKAQNEVQQQEEKKEEVARKKKESGDSFVGKLTETIINNIQVTIRNVHFCYEDEETDPNIPFSLSVSLEEVSARSTDSNWEYNFIKDQQALLYKLVKLRSFSMYMNNTTSDKLYSNKDNMSYDSLCASMLRSMNDTANQYILRPVHGSLKLTMQKNMGIDLSLPKIAANLSFDDVSLTLADLQYRQILRVVDYISNFSRVEKFRRFRPAVRPKEDPRAWWRYAINSIYTPIHESKVRISWPVLLERKKNRDKYIKLYKRKLELPWVEPLKDVDLAEFNHLEDILTYDDIVLFRQIADIEIKVEKAKHTQWQEQMKLKKQQEPKKRSWFSWGGSSTDTTTTVKPEDRAMFEMTQQEREELYAQIGYDAKSKAMESTLPPEFVNLAVSFKLTKGTISLVDSASTSKVIELVFSGLAAEAKKLEDTSMKVGLNLGAIELFDRNSAKTQFPRIVYRHESKMQSDLVAVKVETNPPGKYKADVKFALALAPMDIVVNFSLLQKIMQFFSMPNNVNLEVLEQVAKKQLNNIREKARQQLIIALENKKAIDITLNINAPRILIPEDPNESKTAMLLADLGKLNVTSDLDSKQGRKERLEGENLKEEDFYDKFSLRMTEMKIILTDIQDWKSHANYDRQTLLKAYQNQNLYLLEETSLFLSLSKSIVPQNEGYDKLKITGDLPAIKFRLSPLKFEKLMRIVAQMLQFTQNPTGRSQTDLIMSGNLLVRGPGSVFSIDRPETAIEQKTPFIFGKEDANPTTDADNYWQLCWAELRGNKLFLYDSKSSTTPLASIVLSGKAKVTESSTTTTDQQQSSPQIADNDFIVDLAQPNMDSSTWCYPSNLHFYFKSIDGNDKLKWIESIRSVILAYSPQSVLPVTDEQALLDLSKDDEPPVILPTITPKGDISATQVNVRCEFSLGVLSLMLSSEDELTGKSTKISEIKFNRLNASLRQRNFDMRLEMGLQSVAITNLTTPNPYILSCEDHEAKGKQGKQKRDLAKLLLLTTKEGSPDLQDAETLLDMKFTMLNVFLDREALSRLILFGYDMMAASNRLKDLSPTFTPVQDAVPTATSSNSGSASKPTSPLPAAAPARASLKLDAMMESLSLILLNKSETFASMSMSHTSISLTSSQSSMKVAGHIGNLVVTDHSLRGSKYKEILGLHSQGATSLITFTFMTKKTDETATPQPTYTKFLSAQMSSVRVVYLQRFISNIQNYFSNRVLMDALKEGSKRASKYARETAQAISASVELLKLDMQLTNPLIVVPKHYKSHEHFIANLGKIVVRNDTLHPTDTTWLEKFDVAISKMNVTTHMRSGRDTDGKLIYTSITAVKDMDVQVGFTRAVINKHNEYPDRSIYIKISQVYLKLSEKQYAFIFKVLDKNVKNTGDAQQVTSQHPEEVSPQPEAQTQVQQEGGATDQPTALTTASDSATTASGGYLVSEFMIEFPQLTGDLLRGTGFTPQGEEDGIANLSLNQFSFSMKDYSDKTTKMQVLIRSVIAVDKRRNSDCIFKEFINSNSSNDASSGNCFVFTYEQRTNQDKLMNIAMTNPTIVFVPDAVMEIKDFFVRKAPEKVEDAAASSEATSNDLHITDDTFLGEDMRLSKSRRLFVGVDPEYRTKASRDNNNGTGGFTDVTQSLEIVIDGQGCTIHFPMNEDLDSNGKVEPLVFISDDTTLRFKNVTLKYDTPAQSSMYQLGEGARVVAEEKDGVKVVVVNQQAAEKKQAEKKQKAAGAAEAAIEGGRMSIRAELGGTKILLPEDATDPGSRVMALELGGYAIYRVDKSTEKAEVVLQSISAYVTKGIKQAQSNVYIIEPTDVRLKVNGTTEAVQNKKINRRVIQPEINKINTRISYQDLKMLQNISARFGKKEEPAPPEESPEAPEPETPPAIAAPKEKAPTKRITKNDSDDENDNDNNDASGGADDDDDFQDADDSDTSADAGGDHEDEDEESEDDDEIAAKALASTAANNNTGRQVAPSTANNKANNAVVEISSMEIKLRTQSFGILLVDDIHGYDIPLLDFRLLDLDLEMRMSEELHVNVSFDMDADYFNLRIAEWEPILERWGANVQYWRLPTGNPAAPTQQIINLSSLGALNLNVTHAMVETVLATSTSWKQGFASKSQIVSTQYHPFSLRNQTGHKLKFWKSNDKDHQQDFTIVEHGQEVEFDFDINKNAAGAHKSAWKRDYHIYFQFMERFSDKKFAARVSKIGLISIPIEHSPEGVATLNCIVEIVLVEGKKVITIRSFVKIINKTNETIALCCAINDKLERLGELKPRESLGVPFQFISSGVLRVRPSRLKDTYGWSTQKTGFSFVELTKRVGKRMATCRSRNENDNRAFHLILNVKELRVYAGDFQIDIQAPLALDNLLGTGLKYKLFRKENLQDKHTRPELFDEGTLARGERIMLYSMNPSAKENILMGVLPTSGAWKPESELALVRAEVKTPLADRITVRDINDSPLTLELDYAFHTEEAHQEIIIYAPYWLINQTGLKMLYTDGNKKRYAAGQVIPSASSNSVNEEKKSAPAAVEPLMYSFTTNDYLGERLAFKVEDSNFSNVFSIDNAGTSGTMDADGPHRKYHIGVAIDIAPGKFKRTKVVTFTARYILVNRSEHKMLVRQVDSREVVTLDVNERKNFFWSIKSNNPSICIKLEGAEHDWSAPFKIDALGEFFVKVPKIDGNDNKNKNAVAAEPHVTHVQISEQKASAFVIFETAKRSPYEIRNETSLPLTFSQEDTNLWYKVAAKSSVNYTLDDHNKKHSIVLSIAGTQEKINIDKVSKRKMITLRASAPFDMKTIQNFFKNMDAEITAVPAVQQPGAKVVTMQKHVFISVVAKGPTRVLLVTDSAEMTQKKAEKETFSMNLLVTLAGLGISIVDDSKELAYIYFDNLYFHYRTSTLHQEIELKLDRLQIDNQLRNAAFPVMFAPAKFDQKPFLHISVLRLNEDADSIDFYKYASISLQEVDLALDYTIIMLFYNFFTTLNTGGRNTAATATNQQDDSSSSILSMVEAPVVEPDTSSKKMYFQLLTLHPIKMNVTFMLNNMNTDEEGNNGIPQNPVFLLLNTVGVALTNIDNAPLRLNALVLRHPFMSKAALQDRILKHYKRAVLGEFYKIIGSFDFLGNPVGLFNDLGNGVRDFFYEPAAAITKSPQDFLKGVSKGSASLLKNTVHGLGNAASKFTGSVGKGVSMLSMDSDYIKERQKRQRVRPRHVGEGLVEGGQALAKGIFEGATGLFTKPIEGAKQDGVAGFFTGLGKGLIGVPVKPIAGALDFATKTTEGIKNTTTYFDKAHRGRVRKPRLFGKEGVLVPYNEDDAIGQDMLFNLDNGKYNKDQHVYHADIAKDKTLIVTDARILAMNPKSNTVHWVIPLSEIKGVAAEPQGITLSLKQALPEKRASLLFKPGSFASPGKAPPSSSSSSTNTTIVQRRIECTDMKLSNAVVEAINEAKLERKKRLKEELHSFVLVENNNNNNA